MYLSLFTGFVVVISQTANVVTGQGQGGPCRGSPPRCYPTGNVKTGTTCITSAEDGNGTNWVQMENICRRNNGRLVWLREELDLAHLLGTSVNHGIHPHGAMIATGLMSSTADNAGLFWRDPNDYTTFQCCNTATKPCLYNTTADTCIATGCCWTNGQCQYPQNQTLATFNVNTSQMKLSTSPQRQCVGFQLNTDSSAYGHWATYDCTKPVSNAIFICEYKCNTAQWPKANLTNLAIDHTHYTTTTSTTTTAATTTTQATTHVTGTPQPIVSTMKPDVNPPNPGNGTPQGTGAVGNVKPGTNQQTPTNGTSQGTGSGVNPAAHPQTPDNGTPQGTGSSVNPAAHPQTPDNGTPQANTGSVKPVIVGSQGSNCDNKSVSTATGGTQLSNVRPGNNSLLKVLLSLETRGANTNMTFSLEQTLP